MCIRNIKMHNQALLGKWLSQFGEERDNLWRKVIVAKYGDHSVWESKEVRAYGTGVWKSILNGNDQFNRFVRVKVGSGKDILFWKDLWCGSTPLRLHLFHGICLEKESIGKQLRILI